MQEINKMMYTIIFRETRENYYYMYVLVCLPLDPAQCLSRGPSFEANAPRQALNRGKKMPILCIKKLKSQSRSHFSSRTKRREFSVR